MCGAERARGGTRIRIRGRPATTHHVQGIGSGTRLAVHNFPHHLVGRNVLLHEANKAVVHVLYNLTSRSLALIEKLPKLWYLIDVHDVRLRVRYIRSPANAWADMLSRVVDDSDWVFNSRIFRYVDRLCIRQTVDRFATMLENAQVTRYNYRWWGPHAETVDSLSLPDDTWRCEVNLCNPPLASWTFSSSKCDSRAQHPRWSPRLDTIICGCRGCTTTRLPRYCTILPPATCSFPCSLASARRHRVAALKRANIPSVVPRSFFRPRRTGLTELVP